MDFYGLSNISYSSNYMQSQTFDQNYRPQSSHFYGLNQSVLQESTKPNRMTAEEKQKMKEDVQMLQYQYNDLAIQSSSESEPLKSSFLNDSKERTPSFFAQGLSSLKKLDSNKNLSENDSFSRKKWNTKSTIDMSLRIIPQCKQQAYENTKTDVTNSWISNTYSSKDYLNMNIDQTYKLQNTSTYFVSNDALKKKSKALSLQTIQQDLDSQIQTIKLKSKIKNLETKNQKLQNDLTACTEKLAVREEENKNLREQVKEIKASYYQCFDHGKNWRNIIYKLQADFMKIDITQEKTQLYQKLQQQVSLIDSLNMKLTHKDNAISALETELNNLRVRFIDKDDNKQVVYRLKEQIQVSEQKCQTLKAEQNSYQRRYKRTLIQLETKLQVAINQVKAKQKFIQSQLLCKSSGAEQRNFIIKTLDAYKTNFVPNRLLETLTEQNKEIDRLNQQLSVLQRAK